MKRTDLSCAESWPSGRCLQRKILASSNCFTPRLLTYLLTPWCKILFEKLIVTQIVKKYTAFLRNPKVHHRVHRSPPLDPILSQPNPVRPIDPYLPKVLLMLFSHLRLGLRSGLLPSGLPTKTLNDEQVKIWKEAVVTWYTAHLSQFWTDVNSEHNNQRFRQDGRWYGRDYSCVSLECKFRELPLHQTDWYR
jgi:hypothetical protein